MNIRMLATLVLALCGAMAWGVESVDVDLLRELPQLKVPEANRFVSGALDAEDMARLARSGVRHVVNLRPREEDPRFDEEQAAKQNGLRYHHLPIAGPKSLTKENVERFDAVLRQVGSDPALLHCSSGNRVGALVALREGWIKGRSTDEAIEQGRRWGLTGLEASVRALLNGRSGAAD